MSVKKSTTKKRTARTADKTKRTRRRQSIKVDQTVKKNISHAVEQIPEMIMREVKMENLRPHHPNVIERPEGGIPGRKPLNKRMLMWTGVTALSGVIFVMWFLNAKNTIYAISRSAPSQERQMATTAREDLRAIMKSFSKAERNELSAAVEQATPEEIKTTVKNALTSLFLAAATSSAMSATSTVARSITITSSSPAMYAQ